MKLSLLLVVLVAAARGAEPLQAVHRLAGERLMTEQQYGFEGARSSFDVIAFLAVVTNLWQPGLVPIFVVERKGQWELRRLPPQGQANITEPLFFALPPADDSGAAAIAGRWKCRALRGDGSPVYPDFEIAAAGTNVAARFDQGTEFRFAYITGGTFASNRLELRVENVADRYEMIGTLAGQRLAGEWRHLDGSERASWEAERDLPVFQGDSATPLYEWHGPQGKVAYRIEGDDLGNDWKRAERPLCRVWPPEGKPR